MGAEGEVTVDQAHRGYSVATDALGFMSENPLFMKYTPTDGRFAGQAGYGYRSIEAFIEAAEAVTCGAACDEPLARPKLLPRVALMICCPGAARST